MLHENLHDKLNNENSIREQWCLVAFYSDAEEKCNVKSRIFTRLKGIFHSTSAANF